MIDGQHRHGALEAGIGALTGAADAAAARVDDLTRGAAALVARVADLEAALAAARREAVAARRHAPTLVGAATGWQPSWADAIKAWVEATDRPLSLERIYHGGIPPGHGDSGMARAAGRAVWFSYKPGGAAAVDVDKTRALVASCLAAGRTPADLVVTIWHEPVDNFPDPAVYRARFDAHAEPWIRAGFDVVPVFTNWSIVRTEHDALTRYWPSLATGVGVDHYHGDGTGNEPSVALAKVTDFARGKGMRLFVGEFGVPASIADATAAAWIDKMRAWARLNRPRLLCYWDVNDGNTDTRIDGRPLALDAYRRMWDRL